MKKIIALVLAAFVFGGCDEKQGGAGNASAAQLQGAEKLVPDKLLTRRNFYVIFDGSGSMNDNDCAGNVSKIKVAKEAIKTFAASLNKEDNLGLLVFDRAGMSERVPLSATTRATFLKEVDEVQASGGTPLFEAISLGYTSITKQMQRQLNYGEYHLVIVTDGEASDSDNGIVTKINTSSPVVIHTIGFCIGTGHSLNQPGKTYYAEARNREDVKKGLTAVLAESAKFSK